MHTRALRTEPRHIWIVPVEPFDSDTAPCQGAVHHTTVTQGHPHMGDAPVVTIGEEQQI